jgi:hypothetical protein
MDNQVVIKVLINKTELQRLRSELQRLEAFEKSHQHCTIANNSTVTSGFGAQISKLPNPEIVVVPDVTNTDFNSTCAVIPKTVVTGNSDTLRSKNIAETDSLLSKKTIISQVRKRYQKRAEKLLSKLESQHSSKFWFDQNGLIHIKNEPIPGKLLFF